MEAQAEFFRDYFLEKQGYNIDPTHDQSDFEDHLLIGLPNSDPSSDPLSVFDSPTVKPPSNPNGPFSSPNVPIFDVPGYDFSPGGALGGGFDPLVFDLDNSGTIDLVSVENSTVRFDFWGDGFAEKTGWVAAKNKSMVTDNVFYSTAQ